MAQTSTSIPTPKVLPPAAAALVLVTGDDVDLVDRVRSIIDPTDTLDLRSGFAWLETTNARRFSERLVDAVEADLRPRVRLAWAPSDATNDELLRASLLSTELGTVAAAMEQADDAASAPRYEVRYQPVVRLDDRRVIGFESLIRAHAHDRSLQREILLGADDLIDRARRGGWVADFDQLARTVAIRGVGPWLGDGLLFLNVMAPEGRFDVAAIEAAVEQAGAKGIEPDQIVLEAVEHNRYASIDAAAAQLAELRRLGVRVALDDVGDGYSSLALVTAFEPDIVKISGSIVSRLPSSTADRVITAVVRMTHDSGAWVIAENIESEAQAETLAAAGVDWGQGNFLGRPVPQD